MIAGALNLHHVMLDSAIWKLRNTRIASILIRGDSREQLGHCLIDVKKGQPDLVTAESEPMAPGDPGPEGQLQIPAPEGQVELAIAPAFAQNTHPTG